MASTSARDDDGMKERLRQLGLRPTRQRVALAKLLASGGHRHLSAEDVYAEARRAGIQLAYTTVYNILHQFTAAGLLREVVVESGRTWFDTNTGPHLHVLDEESGHLQDVAIDPKALPLLNHLPLGDDVEIADVEVVVRVRRRNDSA
ncbi:transcriptional repressor [Methylonatrum kenyense]|uniref:Fur family transcriptional regulator n=1 Tax=Methylonatrum kenyense TaxID=455253 RepID=UPI0020BF5A3B|nr:Fur family transcriptional regulator [Methylonatrum kenyense]MCK8515590.1 transcriptional repressor [Methylonatrum kenyense]